tara:strand:+ start:574 stop:1173 length:600 start_codon:yes stop_codon:yes gene_type:complete
MATFIERMRTMANDKEAVQRTFADEYEKKKEARKDALFKSLTFRYYDEIKKAIENASKHGRQYVYMNFDRDVFRANFNGLGSPAQFQRLWLTELCNPNSKYLEMPSLNSTVETQNNTCSWNKPLPKAPDWREPFSQRSIFDPPPVKKDSFQGLNFDVWNNAKFTTVFSWDSSINSQALGMCHYHARHWQDEIVETYPND